MGMSGEINMNINRGNSSQRPAFGPQLYNYADLRDDVRNRETMPLNILVIGPTRSGGSYLCIELCVLVTIGDTNLHPEGV